MGISPSHPLGRTACCSETHQNEKGAEVSLIISLVSLPVGEMSLNSCSSVYRVVRELLSHINNDPIHPVCRRTVWREGVSAQTAIEE